MWIMKLPWDVLDGLLFQLTDRMWEGDLDPEVYTQEFNKVLDFAGWTEEEMREEIDRRWELPRRAAVVFQC